MCDRLAQTRHPPIRALSGASRTGAVGGQHPPQRLNSSAFGSAIGRAHRRSRLADKDAAIPGRSVGGAPTRWRGGRTLAFASGAVPRARMGRSVRPGGLGPADELYRAQRLGRGAKPPGDQSNTVAVQSMRF